MAVTIKQFFNNTITAVAGAGSAQVIYINPTSTKTTITYMKVINKDISIRWVNIAVVPNSSGNVGVDASSNAYESQRNIPIGGNLAFADKETIVLENLNDSIQVYAEVASQLNLYMAGVIET